MYPLCVELKNWYSMAVEISYKFVPFLYSVPSNYFLGKNAKNTFKHCIILIERTCKLRNSPMCIIGQCKFVTLIRCNVFNTKQHEFNTSSSKCFASYRSSIKSISFKLFNWHKLARSRLRAPNSWPSKKKMVDIREPYTKQT